MCGIVAMFAHHPVAPEIDRDELRTIRDHMKARGPDGAGEWFSENGRVALGHRRLSIIDLSEAGNQPMTNEDGTIWLTFNGEIYNYKSLRSELITKGHRFRSNSDSEVIVHLYEEEGAALVHKLRGMFAFALWDAKKRAMILARDPYGIKPLYYAEDGWVVRAASQVKALLAGGKVSRLQDPAGIVGFYLTGSVPEPFTTYQEIRSVPAGSIVRVDHLGASAPTNYFSIARAFHEARELSREISDSDSSRQVADAVLDSVRHHLVSDVPVGAFLSAGIDSGALIGLARDAGAQDLQTITLAFEEYRGKSQDEAPLAEEVARHYGTRHTTRVIDESEFRAELPTILSRMDQPSIDGINTYFVSKAAAEAGLKVVLSGLGGDELFGGYPSFKDLPRWVNICAAPGRIPGLGRILRSVISSLNLNGTSPKFAGLVEYGATYPGAYLLRRGLYMPWELKDLLGEETAREGLKRLALLKSFKAAMEPDPGQPFARVATLEASLYMRNQLLRDTDWASMAHSLEVRVPLVDAHLLKTLAPVLILRGTLDGKELLANTPARPLPAAVTQRRKTGFTVPVGKWIEANSALSGWPKEPSSFKPGIHWARRWATTAASTDLST